MSTRICIRTSTYTFVFICTCICEIDSALQPIDRLVSALHSVPVSLSTVLLSQSTVCCKRTVGASRHVELSACRLVSCRCSTCVMWIMQMMNLQVCKRIVLAVHVVCNTLDSSDNLDLHAFRRCFLVDGAAQPVDKGTLSSCLFERVMRREREM